MDACLLRDCLSVTGVDGPGRAMAVGAQGQLVFKKSATELCYYDVQELSITVLQLSKKDPLFDDCYFYDLSFLRGGTLAVCLQRPTTGELFICEGTIDPQEKTVDVGGSVHPTKIFAAKGRHVSLLNDEAGVVLMSYPIRWTGKDYIELFHVSNYLNAGSGDKYVITLSTKDKVDATFGNVFISRNHLYMFYAHDYAKFLLVSLAGSNCGKCQIRASQGLPPSDAYMGKSVLVFEEFALVYAYMNIRSTVKPNLYLLNLTNLKWIPLNLSLSHHFPNGKVSLQKLGEDLIYIHGDCNMSNCPEKAHLYQINIEPLGNLVTARSRSVSLGVAHGCLQYPSVSSLCYPDRRSSSVSATCRTSNETPPTTPIEASAPLIKFDKNDVPVVHRFKKKQSKDETGRRRFSTHLVGKASTGSVDSSTDCMKRSPSCSSLHWGADMAEQCGRSLQDQIKLAHEMGYGEEVVIAALNMHQGHSDKPYQPFESTNAMLDFLNQASGRKEPNKMTLSLYAPTCSENRDRTPRASSVSRSSSFHIGSPRTTRTESHDLFRLIRTLDKEKERDKREVEQQFTRLKTRIHDLERERDSQRVEIERLRAEHEEQDMELQERNERLLRLTEEVNTFRENFDKETIKNLHLAKDLDNQKELTEHRRKKYEEEQTSSQQKETALLEQLATLSIELERKSALLDEQTDIARRMEQRNTTLQTGALLEKILGNSLEMRKHQEETARAQARIEELYDQIQTRFPEMEAEQRRLEIALEESQRQGKENVDGLRREIAGLLEKTTAECCICLSTKPNVVFLPCRHLAICHGCEEDSGQLSDCPACRTKIDSTLTIYS